MKLVVFTDLDGTLLDHATYSYAPARPALNALRARGVPLVLATSKTAAEVAALHRELDLGNTPAIVENGAGIYRPDAPSEGSDAAYHRLRQALGAMPEALRRSFEGFGDMTDDTVARITGLPLENAASARRRCYSEPGLWHGDDAGQDAFEHALAQQGITARRGGRFLTLSFGRTKADAVAELSQQLGAERILALGDAPNDLEMLQAADIAVIVRNDHGAHLPGLPGEAEGRIWRTDLEGPMGWNLAVLEVLNQAEV